MQHYYHDFSTAYLKQAALDSWDNIYCDLPYLSQESKGLSQFLVLSWAFSKSLCESLTNSSEVPKSGKTTTKSLKNCHRYIY